MTMLPTKTPKPVPVHNWLTITLGRVCSKCSLVQARNEFDDSVPCGENQQGG